MGDSAVRKGKMIDRFPLTRHLLGYTMINEIALNHEAYDQSIVNLLVNVGNLAKSAGYEAGTSISVDKANRLQMLIEIEKILREIIVLNHHAQLSF